MVDETIPFTGFFKTENIMQRSIFSVFWYQIKKNKFV